MPVRLFGPPEKIVGSARREPLQDARRQGWRMNREIVAVLKALVAVSPSR